MWQGKTCDSVCDRSSSEGLVEIDNAAVVSYGLKTIRTPSKPSTAKCNLDTYTLFLLAEPKYAGCNRLSEILGDVSHDSINRFLLRERYEPKDLFDEIKQHIDLIDGTLSGDDTVIDKPYSDPSLTELIGYFWSGKHHRVVKGIQLITLYYTDRSGQSVPVNYRIYDCPGGQIEKRLFSRNDRTGNSLGAETQDSHGRYLVLKSRKS